MKKKDQSYFLWRLGQDVLRRCLFPLGTYTKLQVRDYLRGKGYALKAEEGESMEVCFIKGDYRDFLREYSPEIDKEVGPGWFVNSEGVKLGEHKGFPYYTVGQRKRLEIALGKPAYVLKINPQKNTVMLGDAEQLKTEYMLAEQDNLIDEAEVFGNEEPDGPHPLSQQAHCLFGETFGGRAAAGALSDGSVCHCSRTVCCVLRRKEGGRRFVHCLATWNRYVFG